ncbi:fungal specific transcription factor [Phlyctema vagabunda]|uniref:Fungal specific transcription factor n=1 Tax=Phlyctema vagabunda TaxID=108571 RepID=A0ABR4PU52_9HELO
MDNHGECSTSPTSGGHPRWHPIITEVPDPLSDEPNSIYTSDQLRPTTASYLHLIPKCLDLFMEHIYPIMPLIYMPNLRESITRPLEMYEKNIVYSLCALTSTHMMGKNIMAPVPHSWEAAGRFFLDECISVRQSYDFVEDRTIGAVISSYLLSTSFFELNQNRKSWYYLREAITMGQDLGLHDESSYIGLPPAEELCRRRTFWILYVTERSFAILRHKPLTLSKTPAFPSTVHDYESPEIHSGFMHLVQSYHLLDSSFVDSWNEASEAPASTITYKSLQQQLNRPHPSHLSLTDIQKADILVTQQWLRLIVWQSSMRQGLLSSTAEDESMTFSYPLKIAHSLLNVISSLPSTSIEVHGMGIFEKIFEIGNTMLDVMQACGQNIPSENYGVTQDPFETFVRTLSQTPNSQRQYANLLLQRAAEKPEIQRFSQNLPPSLAPPMMDQPVAPDLTYTTSAAESLLLPSTQQSRQWRGSIVGEVTEDGIVAAYTDTPAPLVPDGNWSEGPVWTATEIVPTATVPWMPAIDEGHVEY